MSILFQLRNFHIVQYSLAFLTALSIAICLIHHNYYSDAEDKADASNFPPQFSSFVKIFKTLVEKKLTGGKKFKENFAVEF